MASFDEQLSGSSVLIHRFLFPADGRCGFDISPQDQVGTVRDPAQDTARMVGLFYSPALFIQTESIIILRAPGQGGSGAVPDFNRLDRTDRHDRGRQRGVQLVEDRIPDAGRQSCDPAFNDAAGRIPGCHAFFHIGKGLFIGLRVRHGGRKCQNQCRIKTRLADLHRADRPGIGLHLNPHL